MENINTKKYLVDELIEDKDFDKKIVKSFYYQNVLSPDIFHEQNGNFKMIESIRKKLLDISNAFIDFIGIDFFIHDIILVGSLSNYNWSEFSDVDVHIIYDINDISSSESLQNIILKFFDVKKDNWNNTHNIQIKKYDVELYLQDINDKLFSSGIYSILNNKWISEPVKGKDGIDENLIFEKSDEYSDLIDNLIKKFLQGKDVTSEIDDIKLKLKKFRQNGLERGGEYSYENLTFKLLRRNGYIGKLMNLKKDSIDKKLSVTQ